MKNLITLLILLFPIIGSSQKLIGMSLNNEDMAIGINYIDVNNHVIVGAENGLYKYERAKAEHQKYKIGYSVMFKDIYNGENNLIVTAAPCYNRYNVIYNHDQIARMPEWSLELSARTNFTDRIYVGVQWDVMQKSGGFNISFLMFK